MYRGNPVDLQMERVISADAIFDDTARACKMDQMIQKKITFILNDGKSSDNDSAGCKIEMLYFNEAS